MTRVVALLRGINVGGRRRIGMAVLRDVAEGLGFGDVRTYLQSGNLLATVPPADVGAVAGMLEQAVKDRFDMSLRVLVRTSEELAAVVAANPWSGAAASDGTRVHVAFLDRAPAPERIGDLEPDRAPGDRFHVAGREVYLHYPDGAGRSKLTLDYLERRLGVDGTARNWNTVTALLAMTGS